jgi:hypothetical protein
MIIGQLDLALRLGSVSILLLLAWLLLGQRRRVGLRAGVMAARSSSIRGNGQRQVIAVKAFSAIGFTGDSHDKYGANLSQ